MRVRRQVVHTDLRMSIEFAELLDPIRTSSRLELRIEAEPVAVDPEVNVELEPQPVQEIDPIAVSRFADAGIDDDRLPLRAPSKRYRLR